MSTFQQQIDNIKDANQHQKARIDTIRQIENLTGRPLIVYAANTRRRGFDVPNRIDDSDIIGFSDLIEGIKSKKLDVLLHSPGGSAEATERIVNLLRENFEHIRFLIPNAAYSAATMLALSGDEIWMDERSTLGPIDPQIILSTPQGVTSVPAQAILDAFGRVRDVLKKEPEALAVYLPILQKYDLHILEICENALKLSFTLAQTWLEKYMFRGLPDGKERARRIAKKLSSHQENLSHGRTIGIRKAQEWGLIVRDFREEPELRKYIWELYCLIELYFDRTLAVKLFENSRGVSLAVNYPEQVLQIPGPPPVPSSSQEP
ncbi:serine protease [Candidatus Bipolaricaulota bacterium]|nr:serine protease [Candidatus Bipolaricaulota bacterium]